MRQQQEAERRRLEENRRQQEEMRRQQEMARQQQMEQMRRKREEDERRRAEQAAALNVRNAIQRMRMAQPEDFDALKQDLDSISATELPKCGQQAEVIRSDAEKVVEQAKQRVDSILEQRRKEEERRLAEEAKRKEQEEAVKKLMVEIADLVTNAEKEVTRLKEVAVLPEAGKEMALDEATKLAKSVNEVGVGARASCKSCTDYIVTNRNTMELAKAAAETQKDLMALTHRLHECLRLIVAMTSATTALKVKVVKKACAVKRLQQRSELFDKYDKDGDGSLNRKEMTAYAKGEFSGISLSAEVVDRIFRQLSVGDKIPKESFQRLKMAVAIAQEEEASRQRRAEAEARRKRMEERKAELTQEFGRSSEALDDTEPEVKKAEEKAEALNAKCAAGAGSGDRLSEPEVDEAAQQSKAASEELETVRKQFKNLSEDVEEELKAFVALEMQKLQLRATSFEERLKQVDATVVKSREVLAKQELLEMEALRAKAIKVIKEHAAKEKLSPEDFFKRTDADGDGAVSKSDFLGIFTKVEGCDIETEKLQLLFDKFEEASDGLIPKDLFLKLVRVHFHVVKETVMTTDRAIKASETVRRLEEGEVLEVHEGPIKDEAVGVTRVRGRAVKDDSVGWATVVGNNGGVFLEEGGDVYKVVKETALTTAAELDGKVVRQLRAGEIVEVIEWGREVGSAVRMKVKVKGDAISGWATKVTLDGAVHLTIAS